MIGAGGRRRGREAAREGGGAGGRRRGRGGGGGRWPTRPRRLRCPGRRRRDPAPGASTGQPTTQAPPLRVKAVGGLLVGPRDAVKPIPDSVALGAMMLFHVRFVA